jgi:di/tricarboxylate transporter
MNIEITIVISVIVTLVYLLYTERFRPSLVFAFSLLIFLFTGILTPDELLKGLSNKQVIVIFLLMILTSGLRKVIGNNFFQWIFKEGLSPKAFLLRLMLIVAPSSSVLNNTPIVAFMIPYVKDWSEKNKQSASKFLIPLSFITILGGMITVVGTSTNLVLNGLIQEYKLPGLNFSDFLYLGVIVTLLGGMYLYFFGLKILPENKNNMLDIQENIQNFIIETKIPQQSTLNGKSVKEANLRALNEVFLVEIVRGNSIINPVTPDEILYDGDILFFSGNKDSIKQLISSFNGISLPDQEALDKYNHFRFKEAIIPASSALVGEKVKESDFRKKFNASIIAIQKNGKSVTEKIGETNLKSGDLLLLLTGDNTNYDPKDLLELSKDDSIVGNQKKSPVHIFFSIASFLFLIMGIAGFIDLFMGVIAAIFMLLVIRKIKMEDIKNAIDIDLVILLIAALAIGVSLTKTGAADLLAKNLLLLTDNFGITFVLTLLFLSTILLTSLITNVATVSIVFPIALSLSHQLGVSGTPFFVAIAFASSGDFMTPIGYQTNLMVMGPGGYTFKDFFKVGFPLTVLYTFACITFIKLYYF